MNTDFLNVVTDSLAHIDPVIGGGVAGVLVLGLVGVKVAKSKKNKTRKMEMTTNSIDGNGNNVPREFKREAVNTKEFEKEVEGLTLQTQEFDEPISKRMNTRPASMWDKPTQDTEAQLQKKTSLPHPDLKSSDLIKAAIELDNEGNYENATHYLLEAIKIEQHEKEKLRLRLIAQHYKNGQHKPGSSLAEIVDKLPTFHREEQSSSLTLPTSEDSHEIVDLNFEKESHNHTNTTISTPEPVQTESLKQDVLSHLAEDASFASFLKSEDTTHHSNDNNETEELSNKIELPEEKSWLDEQADLAEEKLLHENNKESILAVEEDKEAASLKAEYPWLNDGTNIVQPKGLIENLTETTTQHLEKVEPPIIDERYTETPIVPESKTHDRELINLDDADLSSFHFKSDPVSGGLNLAAEHTHILPVHSESFPELIDLKEPAPLSSHEHVENNHSLEHLNHLNLNSLDNYTERVEPVNSDPTELNDFMEKLAKEAEEQDRLQQEQDQLEKEKFFKEFGSVIGDLKKEVSQQSSPTYGYDEVKEVTQHSHEDEHNNSADNSDDFEVPSFHLAKELEEPTKYIIWVNWMLQASGKATMKESTFELEHPWGTIQAVEQLKGCLDKESGVASNGQKNTWAVLSVFPLK